MRKYIFLTTILLTSLMYGQTVTENYIKTTAYLEECEGEELEGYYGSFYMDQVLQSGVGGGIGYITYNNGVFRVDFSGNWNSDNTLFAGEVFQIQTCPQIQDMVLGPINSSSAVSTGYTAKIQNGFLYFEPIPSLVLTGVNTTLNGNISNSSINYNSSFSTSLYNCYNGSGGGGTSGNISVQNGTVSVSLSGGWSSTCNIKLGQIHQITGVSVQNVDLGFIGSSSYKVKIENNWVIIYVDESLASECDFDVSINLNYQDIQKLESIDYYDGLGRGKQNIVVNAGGNQEDIITHMSYDALGRMDKEWLPYAISNNMGTYQNNAESTTSSFYNTTKYENTLNPYSEKHIETSSLSRLLEQGSPGSDWQVDKQNDTDHTIKFDYAVNLTDDYVKRYGVTFSSGNPQLQDNGTYPTGELYKTITKDENWQPNQSYPNDHTTEEFKDKLGRIILKRTFNKGKWHDTYYVHDDYGNLTYVLPPKIPTYSSILQAWDDGTINDSNINPQLLQTGGSYSYLSINKNGNNLYIYGESYDFPEGDKYKDGLILDLNISPQIPDISLGNIMVKNASGNQVVGATAYIQNGDLYFNTTNEGLYDFQDFNGNGIYEPSTGEYTYNYFSFQVNLPDYQSLYTPQGIDTATLNDLAYQYKYDYRNRLIEKKIPGKDWEFIIYDNLDRPVMTQDANLRSSNKWMVTKHDLFGRVIYTGLYTDTTYTTRVSMQNHFDSQNSTPESLYESKVTSGTGYNNTYYTGNNFPANMGVNTVNYYDDYNFDHAGISTPTSADCYGVTPTTQTKGLATGSKVIVLGQGFWTTSMNYYDEKARPIYTASKSQWLNAEDLVANKLNFAGRVLETTSKHKFASNPWITTVDKFTYDHIGRLMTQKQNIDSQGEELITKNYYDELGQLFQKDVGNTEAQPLQKVDYTYNVRGWLKNINGEDNYYADEDLFSFGINYNTPSHPTSSYNKPLYNGNISHTHWKTNNESNEIREYAYQYDALNRFTRAYYAENNTNSSKFNAYIYNYDRNGNIERLYRAGQNPTNVNGTYGMDYLTYTYQGNQLASVADSYASNTTSNSMGGFIDGNTSGDDYSYDDNGNLLSDANKSIGNIEYNHYDLPTKITVGGGSSVDPVTGIITFTPSNYIKYTYDALGNKLRMHKDLSSTSHDPVYYYSGDYVYSYGNGNYHLQYIAQPEGYAEPDGAGGYDYVYQYKDHLGNVRLSYKDSDNNGIIDGENTYTTIWEDGFESASGWDGTGHTWGWDVDEFDSNFKLNGNYSARLDTHSHWENVAHSNHWEPINNAQTTDYIYSAWVFLEDVSGNQADVFLFMNENTETGYYTEISSVSTYTRGKWVYIEKKASVPANIDKLNIRIDNDHAGKVWFDDVKIIRVDPTNNSEVVEENNYYPFGGSHKGYNNVINGTDHKYGFGGKEEQDELGLQWMDFGARNYDKWLGRWMNIDPMAKNYMKYSPYNYALNNPVINVDEGGKFVLPAHILNDPKYAKLVSYVKNDIHKVLNNKKIVNSLKKFGGFSDSQLKEAFTYGSGPEIDVKQLGLIGGEPSNGRFYYGTSTLNIDVDIIEALQNAEGLDSDAWLLILSSTILHELTHYGNDQLDEEDKYKGEEGTAFELDVYGINLGQNEFGKAKDFIKKWIEDQKQKREEAQQKEAGFNELINNIDSLEEGKYTWNGTDWVKTD